MANMMQAVLNIKGQGGRNLAESAALLVDWCGISAQGGNYKVSESLNPI